MPHTPNRGYPYPSSGDRAVVHTDIRTPLEWIDADMQTARDEIDTRVRGEGATALWVGTYDEYDALSQHSEDTIYIIRGGERSNPGKRWGLGVPAFTAPAEGTQSFIRPTLPPLALEDWGYLVIVMTMSGSAERTWDIPDGWQLLADQSEVADDAPDYGIRPMGVFKAPAGTADGLFSLQGSGQGRIISAAFPIRLEPTNEGMALANWPFLTRTFTVPGTQFVNPAVPITIASSLRSSLAGTIVPSIPEAGYNQPTPTTIVSGMSLTVLHLIIGESPVNYAGETSYTVSDSATQYSTAYRIGIGSM